MTTQDLYYKAKYLKYKQKYLELQQHGGLGYIKSWIASPMFRDQNKKNKLNTGTNIIYDTYKDDLDKMLILDTQSKLINLNFTDNFHTNIYIDTDNSMSINVDSSNKLTLGKDWKYEQVPGTKKITTDNSTILFIQHKETKEKKVLKTFIGALPEKSVLVKLEDIQEYLSLQVSRMAKLSGTFSTLTGQAHNLLFDYKNFIDTYNYNDLTGEDLILTNRGDSDDYYLYLASGNSNAINDLIINLILQKINNDGIIANNFVKYYHMFITKYNGQYTYCIVMDSLDGSIDNLIRDSSILENNPTLLYDIMKTMQLMCEPIKKKPYLFTHTDMKIENVFYKIYDRQPENSIFLSDITEETSLVNKLIVAPIIVGGTDKFIVYYLADYDKSSITYHNIRFYNNTYNPEGTMWGKLMHSDMKSSSAKVSDNNKIYKINRNEKLLALETAKNIEEEQFYMRYTMFPYYTSFDYVSLLTSLAIFINIDDPKYGQHFELIEPICAKLIVNHKEFFKTCFSSSWGLIEEKYMKAPGTKYGGNFGLLTILIIENNIECIQPKKLGFSAPVIKSVFVSPNESKLCLCMPYIANPFRTKTITTGTGISGLVDMTKKAITSTVYSQTEDNVELHINIDETKKIYQNFDELFLPEYNKYIISHTGNRTDLDKKLVVKVNKYSSGISGIGKSVYNYDNFNTADLDKIKKYFVNQPEFPEEDFFEVPQ